MTFRYDGTFDGFLTLVFEAYRLRQEPVQIQRPGLRQEGLFDQVQEVQTDAEKADRVWKGLGKYLCREERQQVYYTFLSELPEVEMLLWRYIRLMLQTQGQQVHNFADASVRAVQKLGHRVWVEKHRMEAFVRFSKTDDGLFAAVIDPQFNVLPLLHRHFSERYPDMPWLIFDSRRNRGLLHQAGELQEVHLDQLQQEQSFSNAHLPAVRSETDDEQYQRLWLSYFEAVNIPARRNPRLQLRHMPRRYWKYLPEKQPKT